MRAGSTIRQPDKPLRYVVAEPRYNTAPLCIDTLAPARGQQRVSSRPPPLFVSLRCSSSAMPATAELPPLARRAAAADARHGLPARRAAVPRHAATISLVTSVVVLPRCARAQCVPPATSKLGTRHALPRNAPRDANGLSALPPLSPHFAPRSQCRLYDRRCAPSLIQAERKAIPAAQLAPSAM